MKKYFFLCALLAIVLCAYSNATAQVKTETNKYFTALLQGCGAGGWPLDLKKVKNAISQGVNINQQEKVDNTGRTALMYAARNGSYEIVEFLLKNKAKVNIKDKNDYTALHYAALLNFADIVKLLIENKADVFSKDIDGKTPLDAANILFTSGDYNEVINMLKSAMENKGKITTKAGTKTGSSDSEFEQFWNEFKAAVVAGDANKVADMTIFPLQLGSVEPLNQNEFLNFGCSTIFADDKFLMKQFNLIKNTKPKSKIGKLSVQFTKISNKEIDNYWDWVKMYKDQDLIELKFGEPNWADCMCYFAKINGKYKFVGCVIAG